MITKYCLVMQNGLSHFEVKRS